jgi:hypothetical protein
MYIFKKIRHFLKHKKAVISIEFALLLPLLILLFFGVVEISNRLYAQQKNQTAAFMAQNLIGTSFILDTTDINAVGNLLQNEILNGFTQGNVSLVVTILGSRRSIIGYNPSPPTSSPLPVPDLYVVYRQSFGTDTSPTTRFPYNRGTAGSDIDIAYGNTNALDATTHADILAIHNTLGDVSNPMNSIMNQYIIVEIESTYLPMLNVGAYLGLGANTIIRYETPLAVPRVGRYSLLPDDGEIY